MDEDEVNAVEFERELIAVHERAGLPVPEDRLW